MTGGSSVRLQGRRITFDNINYRTINPFCTMEKIVFHDLHYLRQYPQVLVNQLTHAGDEMYGKVYVFQLGRRVRLSFFCDLKKKVYHCECYYYGSRSPFSTYTRASFSELRQTLFDSLL